MPARTSHATEGLFTAHHHITDRDRHILAMLEAHQVLSSDQIHRLFFTAARTCQLRLDRLRGLDLVDRFRFARPGGGTQTWKWVLGWSGARLQAAAADRPAPTERAHREHVLRLSMRPSLPHLLATNEFFVRLHHAARATVAAAPAQPPAPALMRWWPERTATAKFSGVHPDGHGVWTQITDAPTASRGRLRGGFGGGFGHAVGFFLECDLGSENLARLIGKLDGYARLADTGGPRYPVLFWLPGRRREDNLQHLLRTRLAAQQERVPVATATHDTDPAGRVWQTATGSRRVHLSELPSDHGVESATNPNWRGGHLDLSDQGHHVAPARVPTAGF